MVKYDYRIAQEKDIILLESIGITFHYIKSVKTELIGEYTSHFLWILMEKEGFLAGYARCKKIHNWWIMEGLYIDDKTNDIWAAYKLTQYTIEYLRENGKFGILSWTDSPLSGKANIFLKNNFIIYPKEIYRFILYRKSILNLMSLSSKKIEKWEIANYSDFDQIIGLSRYANSFVDNIVFSNDDKMTKWMIYKESNMVLAAICWWKHDDLLDIHYTLSLEESFDCIDGIIKLLQLEYNSSLSLVKINLESKRFSSLFKLLRTQPCTYGSGYINYLLKQEVQF